MKRTAFDVFHPILAGVYFAALLMVSMAVMQPIYLLISFVGALAYRVVLRGVRDGVRTLLWMVVLVAVVAVLNPLFSASGSTELFRIGGRAWYLESFVYGACMGTMLTSVLLTFSNASCVLTSDKVMALFGGIAPTLGLMVSMTARLMPQFVRRGRDIGRIERACSAAHQGLPPSSGRNKGEDLRVRMRANLRLTSVLMGWSMEDSLETADAMRARGWGVTSRRTTYARFRFRRLDGVALALVGLLVVGSAAMAWMACASFAFYPRIAGLAPWWSYVPYALFAAVPLGLEVREWAVWNE